MSAFDSTKKQFAEEYDLSEDADDRGRDAAVIPSYSH